MVEHLLQTGANVHARDDGGLIPLHNACSFGHAEVVSLLLCQGADPNARDNWNYTPLHEAAIKGKIDVCIGERLRYALRRDVQRSPKCDFSTKAGSVFGLLRKRRAVAVRQSKRRVEPPDEPCLNRASCVDAKFCKILQEVSAFNHIRVFTNSSAPPPHTHTHM